MNKQILRIAIALPMVVVSAASSLANDARKPPVLNQVNIHNIELIDTQEELPPSTDIIERPKPRGFKGHEIGGQQTPNRQVLGNPANLRMAPRPSGWSY